ncbi:MAG: ribosomal L7Ae/L30e/S12e/Gadd45 family protein [Clostridia bacterium]|nr:ribosomal L7Ae/L30e/S12e/Gadd45 family protein [Clostridia bacterium]
MERLKSDCRKVTGVKQVTRALKAGKLDLVYVANDADTFLYQQIVRAAEEAGVPCVRVASMKELGIACGVEVSAAAAGILK